jgi:anti-anti-sigma factor
MLAMASPPDEFSISTTEREGRVHVTLFGELDLAGAPALEALLTERIDAGREVVVDLRALEFMDSSGVRVLVAAHARAERTGARLTVVRPARATAVDRIIEVAGLEAALNLIDDPAQAA